MRCRIADSFNPLYIRHIVNEFRQIRMVVVYRSSIGVYVLTQEMDFAYPLARQGHHLAHNRVYRAADFLTARIRNDAKATILAAPFHDG